MVQASCGGNSPTLRPAGWEGPESPGRRPAVLPARAAGRAGPWGAGLTDGVPLRGACRGHNAFSLGGEESEDSRNSFYYRKPESVRMGTWQTPWPSGVRTSPASVSPISVSVFRADFLHSPFPSPWGQDGPIKSFHFFHSPGQDGLAQGRARDLRHTVLRCHVRVWVLAVGNAGRRHCLSTGVGYEASPELLGGILQTPKHRG